MLLALQNAPTSTWVGIFFVVSVVIFGLLVCLANEIVKFAADQDALDDAAYDRAHGDCFPIFDTPVHVSGDTE